MNALLFALSRNFGKVDLPPGVSSRDIVTKAIAFDKPPRIPYMLNTHPSDFFFVGKVKGNVTRKPKELGARYKDIWGVTWEVTGRGWDHACGHPLADLGALRSYRFPDLGLNRPSLVARTLIGMGKRRKKYIVGANTLNLFELIRSLMGFEECMMAPYSQPEGLRALIATLVDITCQLIDSLHCAGGLDGFMTWEDLGLQAGMAISVDHFREFYKPAYKKIVDFCHARGIHFIWHCCGDIIPLLAEMVDVGVDVLQLDQPRLMGYENFIKACNGKLCFFNCVDIQWSTRPETTVEELAAETEKMVDVYMRMMPDGGFIMKHYSEPWDINLPKEKELAIANAFFRIQKAKR